MNLFTMDADAASMGRLFAAHPVKYLYVVNGAGLYQVVVPLRALTQATAAHRQSLRAADLTVSGRPACLTMARRCRDLCDGIPIGVCLISFNQ